jgi:hypothetical protein
VESEGKVMLSEPGFWLMIAGGLLIAAGFIGLVFHRLSPDMPFHEEEANAVPLASDPTELPNLPSTDRNLEVAKTFGKARPRRTG